MLDSIVHHLESFCTICLLTLSSSRIPSGMKHLLVCRKRTRYSFAWIAVMNLSNHCFLDDKHNVDVNSNDRNGTSMFQYFCTFCEVFPSTDKGLCIKDDRQSRKKFTPPSRCP